MAKPQELDILARSLSGDWQSRIDLFKKFIWDSSRIRRIGSKSRYLDDFLHDSFTNVLRTGHSLDPEQDMGEWVASVASWTALERQRAREDKAASGTPAMRMCAAMEADEPENRARLASYIPPRSGSKDSLLAHLSRFLGEPQSAIFSKRAVEGASWQDAAAAVGKPLNAIGPPFVRAVESLSRFFGAPPHLNDDLEPVFAWAVREDAAVSHGDPLKPKGRLFAMQRDPVFYGVTPEMRKIGLTVPSEVRTLTLWEAAQATAPPREALRDHLAQCRYCADVLRAMLLLHQALRADPGAPFLLCPGASTLLNTPAETYEPLERHLAECSLCRQERARLLGTAEEEPDGAEGTSPARSAGGGRTIAWAGAAFVLLLIGYLAASRYLTPTHHAAVQPVLAETPPPAVAPDPRYTGLAEPIPISDARWLANVLPQNRTTFYWLVDEIQNHRAPNAAITASGLAEKDPGIQMLYAELLYQLKGVSYGYQAMLKAEAMTPRNSFRCWVALQAAVIVGDMQVVNREVQHLVADPAYSERAKALLARVRSRG